MKLSDYSNNVFSQFGEDGIIEKIFEIIKPEFNTCIEFGAWDGLHLSNTANLWKNKNWKAILIECNKEKFELLKLNINSNVIGINEKVDNKENSLDSILEKNNINKNIDFLSIDIDGNDYYILESLQFNPKVISIEYNPTIPYWIELKQNFDDFDPMGSSPFSINKLMNLKDYYLVSATDVNMFFVKKQYYNLFKKYNTNISDIICKKYYNIIISKYNGKSIEITPFVYGNKK